MINYFNNNNDPNEIPVDPSTPRTVIASIPDNSPKGVFHRFLGEAGIVGRVIAILVIGGAMLTFIGFNGYRYVSTSIAEMLVNPYDALNAADDLSGVLDNSVVNGADVDSGNTLSGGSTSSVGKPGGGTSSNSTVTVQTPSNQNTTRSIVSSAGFTHPGVMVSLGQLNTTKKRISASESPWGSVTVQAKSSTQATKKPTLTGMVRIDDLSKACDPFNPGSGCVTNCGYESNPNFGCKDETGDAVAAYTQALLWYYTGDEAYAQSSIAILNGWSSVLRGHLGDNRAVQLAWSAESFVRAAEIMRYTYSPTDGKASFNVDQFNTMLQSAFVPTLSKYGYSGYNGNWELSAIDAKMSIAVYTDNRALFNSALAQWRARVPVYIYLKSDGPQPREPAGGEHSGSTELGCFWLSNKAEECKTKPKSDPKANYQNGQIQETCRDFWHVGMGLGSMLNAAETAAIQGVDLYGEQQERIMTGLSYTAQIALAYPSSGYPQGFCNGVSGLKSPSMGLPFEVAYNAYVTRKGVTFKTISIPGLPSRNYSNGDPVKTIIEQNAGRKETVSLMTAWETLSHRQAGN